MDPRLPDGYAPFNVEHIDGRIVVAYAKQDAEAEDEVAGAGLGAVDIYDTSGRLLRRLATGGALNAPWGLVRAPDALGRIAGDLLVGNFGDGRITAYDPRSGDVDGQLVDESGHPVVIDGLWALRPGNGLFATPGQLVFTAGPDDEAHGLLGTLSAIGRG